MAVNATLKETDGAYEWAYICIITVYANISLIRRTLLGSFGWFCLSVKVKWTINNPKSLKNENSSRSHLLGESSTGDGCRPLLSSRMPKKMRQVGGEC